MFIAITKTLTCSLTALLSTKTTTSEPSLSDTCMVEPGPSVDSNETTAMDNEMNQANNIQHVNTLIATVK